jgi:membrane protease YdiL (CAAX protease family)
VEVFLFISCFIIPYLLFIKKIRDTIKYIFNINIFMSVLGVLFFSCYPMIFDVIKFNLSLMNIFFRVIYILSPFCLLMLKENILIQTKFKRIIDIFVFIIIWLPIEFNLLPGGLLKYSDGVILQTTLLGMIPVAFYLFIVVSPIADNYYIITKKISWKDFAVIAIAFILIAAIILPAGTLIKFLIIKTEFESFLFIFIYIFSFLMLVAIPEEFFFRAVLVHIIKQDKEYNKYIIIFISSIMFGCAHILNKTPGWSSPNWAYLLFSAIAGWFYAWTYLKTNKFFVPVLLHALVDGTWIYLTS